MPYQVPEPKIFACTQSTELAEKIAKSYGTDLGKVLFSRYSDGEFQPSFEESVRGARIFIIGSTNPSSENLMEMLLMLDAAKRASARHITAVMPYFGWARQDRKDKPRVPISAKLVANLLGAAGTNRVLTMDLHKAQIQGFFDIPVDHLFAAPVFIDYLSRVELSQDVTIVSPDAGGVERARAYAKRLNADLAIIDKRRSEGGHAEVMHVVGQVKDRVCIIQDDIVDTAGTLQQASQALKDSGAASVMACAVHGVLSGPAFQRIDDSVLEQLIVTNTIPLRDDFARSDKVQVLSVANLLGKAIQSIHQETSVSSLFV